MGADRRTAEFTAYVAARRPYLRHAAYLYCGDWHVAEDLVQTALAKLYVAWPRIRSAGAEDAYARRIILRAHIDERRRPWRRERSGLDGVTEPAVPSGSTLEDNDALMAALRRLPDRQRATIVLRYWCGLSVEETARDLGCSAGTVKSQTSRAIATLRSSLTPTHSTNG